VPSIAVQVISSTGFDGVWGWRTSFTETGRLDMAIGAAAGLHDTMSARQTSRDAKSGCFDINRDFTRICF
jgi:hypothetical protein